MMPCGSRSAAQNFFRTIGWDRAHELAYHVGCCCQERRIYKSLLLHCSSYYTTCTPVCFKNQWPYHRWRRILCSTWKAKRSTLMCLAVSLGVRVAHSKYGPQRIIHLFGHVGHSHAIPNLEWYVSKSRDLSLMTCWFPSWLINTSTARFLDTSLTHVLFAPTRKDKELFYGGLGCFLPDLESRS